MKFFRVLLGSVVAVLGFAVAGCGGEETPARVAEGTPDGYVRVTRVIDGDSVVVTRFGETRLIGVNTPEEGRCYETEATRFTRERLENQRVGYEFDEDRKDRYGRTLLYLYRYGMHNIALVREGYAEVETVYPNDKYVPVFLEAEQDAEQSRRGLHGGKCERRKEAAAQQRSKERAERDLARDRAVERRLRRERRRRARQERRLEREEERRLERELERDERRSEDGGDGSGGGGGFDTPGTPGE